MTTREIYFKALIMSDLPMGRIGYTYKDKNGVIQIGKTLCVSLKTNENIVINAIKQMNKIEQLDGFMFWNLSLEGEIFYRENWSSISKGLIKIIL